ncbi:Gamma_tubulin [Hexamita inflata]|uniref:Gamma tubulin n=1 Tax=Hexamita inflata TaxID=28002 RepID=A0AA86R4L4_9EUKA|nr:Gamma tubulin [Hexamita inflata]
MGPDPSYMRISVVNLKSYTEGYDEAAAVKQMYEFKQATLKTSVLDVMRRLLHPNNCIANCSRDGCYLSLLNIVSGNVDVSEIQKSTQRLRERRQVKFAPWTSNNVQICVSKSSQLVQQKSSVQGLMLANHSFIAEVFSSITKQFKKQFGETGEKAAYIQEFRKTGLWEDDEMLDAFISAKESVEGLIQEYKQSETARL